MQSLDFTAAHKTSLAASGALRSRGFRVEDFEVEEEHGAVLDDLFGLTGGLLRVRCCSTGEERMYPTGSGSVWLGALLMDLGRGHFARAARGGPDVDGPRSAQPA